MIVTQLPRYCTKALDPAFYVDGKKLLNSKKLEKVILQNRVFRLSKDIFMKI